MAKECCSTCGRVHEPDNDEAYVDYEGYRFHKPFRCMCCGKKICALQFAFCRCCAACDMGACDSKNKAFKMSAVHPHPTWYAPILKRDEQIREFAIAVNASQMQVNKMENKTMPKQDDKIKSDQSLFDELHKPRLYPKYRVIKTSEDLNPVNSVMLATDPNDINSPFVLMPRKDPAAMAAMLTYMSFCEPALANEIRPWLRKIADAEPIFGSQGVRNLKYVRSRSITEAE